MVTRGTNLFQSLHVSLLRRVRKTRDAGAEICVEANVVNVAVPAGMSGVPRIFSAMARGGMGGLLREIYFDDGQERFLYFVRDPCRRTDERVQSRNLLDYEILRRIRPWKRSTELFLK